ncbi:MAG: dihydropteroate synthase [Chitinophagaceae bacterium]|nr:dihydropteroate synthase [Chitinophagaceae bacterium]
MRVRGHYRRFDKPIVMGILNATPDSFYNQGRDSTLNALLENAHRMVQAGASMLDIGGMSTRPGASEISVDEEIKRVIPLVQAIRKELPEVLISIDTYRSEVAQKALRLGADIINDISAATFDPNILTIVAEYHAPFIAMHSPAKSDTMQINPHYHNVVTDILAFFAERIQTINAKGIPDIILDLGFGFGKTLEHNYTLLNHLHDFDLFQRPMLVGISRKSMIYKALQTQAEQALNGTTALHMIALQQGANILRVHDVREAIECIQLHECLQQNS